jgi:hypothetical protein
MTRFGRQPYMDVLRKLKIPYHDAAEAIGVAPLHLRNAGYGYISPRHDLRRGISTLLAQPLEELFTDAALSSQPAPPRTPRRPRAPRRRKRDILEGERVAHHHSYGVV